MDLTSVYITTGKLGELNSLRDQYYGITSMVPKARALYFWSAKVLAKL